MSRPKKMLSIPRITDTGLALKMRLKSFQLSAKKFSFNSMSTYSCLIAPLWKFCYVVCFEFCWIYVIIGQRSEKYNFLAQFIYSRTFCYVLAHWLINWPMRTDDTIWRCCLVWFGLFTNPFFLFSLKKLMNWKRMRVWPRVCTAGALHLPCPLQNAGIE